MIWDRISPGRFMMDTYQQMDLFHDNDDLPAFQQTVPLYVKSLTTLLSVFLWR